jgi:UDP-N-acetylmuramate--alanine ligase
MGEHDEIDIDPSWLHFIGIGGIGMSGLAKIFAGRGSRVSGSDAKDSHLLRVLRQLGCEVCVGHDAASLGEPTGVVVCTAIRANNPELVAARARGIPVVHRAQMLAYLMRDRRAVVVAGTHGKTTTTSMLSVAFQRLGLDPSYAIGGELDGPGSNAYDGSSDLFVAEADESDRSFHYYRPTVAAILNIEEDHHDHYSSLAQIIESFEQFARRVVPGGVLVLSADDPATVELASRLAQSAPELRVVTFGEADDADWHIAKVDLHRLTSETIVRSANGEEFTLRLLVPGRHNAHNAAAALAVGVGLGLPAAEMAQALGAYAGVGRRFQIKGQACGVTVVDSYAHHPSEIAADLATARQAVQEGRVVVVFQPHLFTRTQALGPAMGQALAAADIAVIMDIYPAREDPISGVTSTIVAHAALEHGALVRVVHQWSAVPDVVAGLARPGDLVLTMGAGDVTMLGPQILARFAQA